MIRHILAIVTIACLSSCVSAPIHQGNVLPPEKVYQIREGHTRFQVESILGTPVLEDALHPNRVVYIEDVDDDETDELFLRGIEIRYDEALRVKSLRMFGYSEE